MKREYRLSVLPIFSLGSKAFAFMVRQKSISASSERENSAKEASWRKQHIPDGNEVIIGGKVSLGT